MRVPATSPLRMWGYCLLLVALAFVQQPGRIVGDTKFDLVEDPVGLLARATDLWDPNAAFGQLQNQAYGYFWPMGPFFALGDVTGVPAWVVQRLWWALLLCVAFVGVVRLARALGLGVPWTQVTAGFAHALSAHVLTLLGPTSVEAWPTAVAPWVLLPLVRGSEGGSVRRAAALSALFVALCGGVNAVAVLAVLPLGALWLLTRSGTRRWQLFGWWVLFTVLATAWWVVPLLILGRYSVPFLDYIENAPITTLPTSLPDILAGTSDWVAYVSPQDWASGNLLGTTPILLINLAVVAGAGLAGAVMRDNPHRQFLLLGVIVGVVLVGFGYTGPLAGWWAAERELLLDGPLAPFRNLHKFDLVLRLALTLGLAHFLAAVATRARAAARTRLPLHMVLLATVVSVVGAAVPAYAGRLAPGGSFEEVPDYWREAAAYLGDAPRRGVALEVPATAFGDYLWGSPHDDVLQPLGAGPWAVRNVIPLAQPGNVRFLDAVTETVERGRPSPALARFLQQNGVDHLVVRNDVEPGRGAAPDPVVLHQALDLSPGIEKVAEFGPVIGGDAVAYVSPGGEDDPDPTTESGPDDSSPEGSSARLRGGRVRVLTNRGRLEGRAAVEIYGIEAPAARVTAWRAGSVPVVAGGPAAGLETPARILSGPTVLAGDRGVRTFAGSPRVLTDGLRRRETAFTSVRANESATMTRSEPWHLSSVVPNHRLFDEQAALETTATWQGVAGVRASSAQSRADSLPPIREDQLPGAALDGIRSTTWVSAGATGAVGEWWEVDLGRPRPLSEVTIRTGNVVGSRVTRIRIVTQAGAVTVPSPPPRSWATFELPAGRSTYLRLRAVSTEDPVPGAQFTLSEVRIPGVEAERYLRLPEPFSAPADHILLAREPDRPACAVVGTTNVCDDLWRLYGEEKDSLRRRVVLPADAGYANRLTATVRAHRPAVETVMDQLPVRVRATRALSKDVRASALAMIDSDPDTAWVAAPQSRQPRFVVTWDEPVRLSTIDLDLAEGSPGALPRRLVLKSRGERRVVSLDDGRGSFRPLVTDELKVRVTSVERAYSFEGPWARLLSAGVGELSFPYSSSPEVDAGARLDLGCGSGPELDVEGSVERSRVVASVEQLMSSEPLRVGWCGDAWTTLREGANDIRVLPSPLTKPEQLHLQPGDPRVPAPERITARALSWGPATRTVRVSGRSDPALLVVRENLNRGWQARADGRTLQTQRVDGWKQGWIVPAGQASTVTLEFTPNRPYRVALLAGAGALLLVLLAALLPARRRGRRPPSAQALENSWPAVLVPALAAGVLGGLVGVVLVLAGILGGLAVRGRDRVSHWLPWSAGAAVAAAGLAHAWSRTDGFRVSWWPAQAFGLLALSVAVCAVVANGPRFLRRRKGRSSSE